MWKSALCFAAVLPLGLARQARCDESPRAQVNTIFDAVEGPNTKGKWSPSDAYTRLAKLKPSPHADRRARYAFLLGLIETRKHREAVECAADILKTYPDYLPARSLRARLLLNDHKFEEAFAELDALGERLSAHQQPKDLSHDADAACQFLGLAFGYLEGPAGHMVKGALGAEVKDRVLMHLSPAQRQVFDEHYQMVQTEHSELITNGEKALEATRAKTQAKIQAEAQVAAERKAKLDEDKHKVEATADEQIAGRMGQSLERIREIGSVGYRDEGGVDVARQSTRDHRGPTGNPSSARGQQWQRRCKFASAIQPNGAQSANEHRHLRYANRARSTRPATGIATRNHPRGTAHSNS
jgi:hypothetical protein